MQIMEELPHTTIKSSGHNKIKYIAKNIKCRSCDCIFDQSEEMFFFIIQISTSGNIRKTVCAKCPECDTLPRVTDRLPEFVMKRIKNNVNCYRIQNPECPYGGKLSNISAIEKVSRSCGSFRPEKVWITDCTTNVLCRSKHTLDRKIIEKLPEIVREHVEKLNSKVY